MKLRQARKIFKAYYSPKKNYWNNYQGFTLSSFLIRKNPRLLHALNIAYKYGHQFPIPTKPIAIQGTTSMACPKRGGGYGII